MKLPIDVYRPTILPFQQDGDDGGRPLRSPLHFFCRLCLPIQVPDTVYSSGHDYRLRASIFSFL